MTQLVTNSRPFDPKEFIGGQSLRTTYSDAYAATFRGSLDRNVTGSLIRAAEQTSKQRDSNARLLTPDEANERYGLGGRLKFEGNTREGEAKFKYDLKIKEMRNERAVSNVRTGIIGNVGLFSGGIAGSALDPVAWGAGAFLLPAAIGFKGLQALKTAQMINTARMARGAKMGVIPSNVLGRGIALGALEGAVGSTVLEPIIYAQAKREGADYDLGDALMNIAFGTGFGAIARPLGSAFSQVQTKIRLNKHSENFNLALAQALENKKINVTSSMKQEFDSVLKKTLQERKLISSISDKNISDGKGIYVKADGKNEYYAQFSEETGALQGTRGFGASKAEAIKSLQDKYNNTVSFGLDPTGIRRFDAGLPTPRIIAKVEEKVRILKADLNELKRPTAVQERVRAVSEKQGANYEEVNNLSDKIKSLDETTRDLKKMLNTKLSKSEVADVNEQLNSITGERLLAQQALGKRASVIKSIEDNNTILLKNEKLRKEIELLNLEHDLKNMKRDVSSLPEDKIAEYNERFSSFADDNIIIDDVRSVDIVDPIMDGDIDKLNAEMLDIPEEIQNMELSVDRLDSNGNVYQKNVTMKELDDNISQAKTIREKMADYVACRLGK